MTELNKVSILGTVYQIAFCDEKEDERLENYDGYCDFYSKMIVITNNDSDADVHDFKSYQRRCLRHEIVHAFLFESGLAHNSSNNYGAWAMNEEMIDFFAIQGEKIHLAWEQAYAVDLISEVTDRNILGEPRTYYI